MIEKTHRNYKKEYDELITNAKITESNGKRKKNPWEHKYETHHIIPKCVGGTDEPDNLVNLTLAEHFDAHYLLTKIYNNGKLNYVFKMMYEDEKLSYNAAKREFKKRRRLGINNTTKYATFTSEPITKVARQN